MLNQMEQEALDAIHAALELLAPGRQLKRDRMWLMGKIRDAAVHLRNKQYGCLTGKHSGVCTCK